MWWTSCQYEGFGLETCVNWHLDEDTQHLAMSKKAQAHSPQLSYQTARTSTAAANINERKGKAAVSPVRALQHRMSRLQHPLSISCVAVQCPIPKWFHHFRPIGNLQVFQKAVQSQLRLPLPHRQACVYRRHFDFPWLWEGKLFAEEQEEFAVRSLGFAAYKLLQLWNCMVLVPKKCCCRLHLWKYSQIFPSLGSLVG